MHSSARAVTCNTADRCAVVDIARRHRKVGMADGHASINFGLHYTTHDHGSGGAPAAHVAAAIAGVVSLSGTRATLANPDAIPIVARFSLPLPAPRCSARED